MAGRGLTGGYGSSASAAQITLGSMLEIRWGLTSVGAPCPYSLSTAHRRHGLLPEQHRSVRVCPSSGEKTDTTVCPWISPVAHDVEHTCAETMHASFLPLD